MKSVRCFLMSLRPKALASYNVNAEFLKSSVSKIIIDFGVTDHFFSNRVYFSTYEKYHPKFQTAFEEVLEAYEY